MIFSAQDLFAEDYLKNSALHYEILEQIDDEILDKKKYYNGMIIKSEKFVNSNCSSECTTIFGKL